ncbi:hypothetical protein ILYODFUR_008126 [Ilyodon furcidens]|uniref:Uncharacterized protein n=1 Tax=Ilyodon furcidens TaxID=33524 RepID=A0ABV0VCJ0_9TELE
MTKTTKAVKEWEGECTHFHSMLEEAMSIHVPNVQKKCLYCHFVILVNDLQSVVTLFSVCTVCVQKQVGKGSHFLQHLIKSTLHCEVSHDIFVVLNTLLANAQ